MYFPLCHDRQGRGCLGDRVGMIKTFEKMTIADGAKERYMKARAVWKLIFLRGLAGESQRVPNRKDATGSSYSL